VLKLSISTKSQQISPSRKCHLTIEILPAQSKWRATGWWFCSFRDTSIPQIINTLTRHCDPNRRSGEAVSGDCFAAQQSWSLQWCVWRLAKTGKGLMIF